MNIFFREIKAHYKGLIGWNIGMIFLIVTSMLKFDTLSTTGQSANDLIKAFPKPLMAIFGISGFDLDTVIGYFGVTFLYIALMATIHAVMIGAEIISKEERDRTTEFLMPKPVSRNRIITSKLIAALVNILILNLVTTITSVIIVDYYVKDGSLNGTVLVMMLGLLLMQLLFFSVGAVFAGAIKRSRLAVASATSVLMVTYIMWVVKDLSSNLEVIKYFTPFYYFEAKGVVDTGRLDLLYVSISIVLIIAMISATYLFYNKRDLKV